MPAHRLAFSQSAARWLLNGLLGGLLASLAAGACAAPALSAEPAECTAIDESALEQAYAQWSREAAQQAVQKPACGRLRKSKAVSGHGISFLGFGPAL